MVGYPTGAFPDCHSPLGVYDINGNTAEHMNLPLAPDQMASRGSRELGYTEMKGSWFIFDSYRAHEDWCRWRAPFWHGSRVMDPEEPRELSPGLSVLQNLGRRQLTRLSGLAEDCSGPPSQFPRLPRDTQAQHATVTVHPLP